MRKMGAKREKNIIEPHACMRLVIFGGCIKVFNHLIKFDGGFGMHWKISSRKNELLHLGSSANQRRSTSVFRICLALGVSRSLFVSSFEQIS